MVNLQNSSLFAPMMLERINRTENATSPLLRSSLETWSSFSSDEERVSRSPPLESEFSDQKIEIQPCSDQDANLPSGPTSDGQDSRRLMLALSLCLGFFFVELTGGIVAGSLALVGDAVHLLTDVISLAISLSAIYLAKQPPTKRFTYGFYRAEVLGVLASILVLWVLTIGLIREALTRIENPTDIDGKSMLLFGCIGLLINIGLAITLTYDTEAEKCNQNVENNAALISTQHPPKKGMNLVVNAAFLHVLGDLLFSIGVICSSLVLMWDPSKVWVDPFCTFLFSGIVFFTSGRLFKHSLGVLMTASPIDVDTDMLKSQLQRLEYVCGIRDFHVWSLTSSKYIMTLHLEILDQSWHAITLGQVQDIAKQYGIQAQDLTVQIEYVET